MNSLFENEISPFPTTYAEILQRIRQVQPIKYGKTRNFLNGAVTYLSPYISRGVISTKQVFEYVQHEMPYSLSSMEKFIQELAWRDYWQQVWKAKGDLINEDLKNTQEPVLNTGISTAVVSANTGIEAIDKGIQKLYNSGYMHNHLRMYTAAICCNMAYSHWKAPARWMYYHLLDGDWASNALSWQWVAGANSNKKYYANQGNINRYCFTDQQGTFLDVEYSAIFQSTCPSVQAGGIARDQPLGVGNSAAKITTPGVESKPTHLPLQLLQSRSTNGENPCRRIGSYCWSRTTLRPIPFPRTALTLCWGSPRTFRISKSLWEAFRNSKTPTHKWNFTSRNTPSTTTTKDRNTPGIGCLLSKATTVPFSPFGRNAKKN